MLFWEFFLDKSKTKIKDESCKTKEIFLTLGQTTKQLGRWGLSLVAHKIKLKFPYS